MMHGARPPTRLPCEAGLQCTKTWGFPDIWTCEKPPLGSGRSEGEICLPAPFAGCEKGYACVETNDGGRHEKWTCKSKPPLGSGEAPKKLDEICVVKGKGVVKFKLPCEDGLECLESNDDGPDQTW